MSTLAEARPVRRLLPDPAETTVAEQLAGLDPGEAADGKRPRVLINFVASADGRATIDGRSGPLGSRTDMEILQRLRTRVDAVMIGAGTMRVERYGRMVSDPALRDYREQCGLAPDPLGVIVSSSLKLPWDARLFTDGGGSVAVLTSSDADPPETATPVEVVRYEGGVDLPGALAWLRGERDIRSVLCEGGPILHGNLHAANVVDELFLTIAPKLAGADERSILSGGLEDPLGLELAWLLEADGELFCRYKVRR